MIEKAIKTFANAWTYAMDMAAGEWDGKGKTPKGIRLAASAAILYLGIAVVITYILAVILVGKATPRKFTAVAA